MSLGFDVTTTSNGARVESTNVENPNLLMKLSSPDEKFKRKKKVSLSRPAFNQREKLKKLKRKMDQSSYAHLLKIKFPCYIIILHVGIIHFH